MLISSTALYSLFNPWMSGKAMKKLNLKRLMKIDWHLSPLDSSTRWTWPPSGHTMVSPPSGHTMVSPPSGHTMVSPPSGLTMVSPPSGHTMVSPPSGLTMVSPPSGHTMVSPPSAQTTWVLRVWNTEHNLWMDLWASLQRRIQDCRSRRGSTNHHAGQHVLVWKLEFQKRK